MTLTTNVTKVIEMMRERDKAEFEGVMRRLPQMVGNRNNSLPWICRLGLRAGMADEQVYDAVMAHCGRPRLGDDEVRRGIAAAHRPLGARPHFIKSGPAERGFVARMVEAGRGTTVEGLQRAARLLPTAMNRRGAMAVQVEAMAARQRFDAPSALFWVGADKSAGGLKAVSDLMRGQTEGVPNFITCNALTGESAATKDGTRLTLRGDNCVVAPRLMLVEFDAMPKEEQLAFVGGVLKTGALRVVSVVWSGGKSFHTLVEVEGEYAVFRERALRLMCSADDPRQRIDRAPLHPSALTRLAGAERDGQLQELVWCDVG